VVSLPWYLLAAGIALVIVGALLAGLPGRAGRGGGRRAIRPRMRDDDIARELRRAQRVTVPSLVVLAGFVCILVSVCWRIARAVL
jgi:hypothetical protein